jgi:GT2 family glycosyltransferase
MDNYLDQERNVRTSRGVTANLFVKRRVFDLCHGFDPSLPSGGDYDFVRRAVAHGARLIYAPTARVFHPTIDESAAYLRKVWNTNRWAAARRSRDGSRPNLGILLTFSPVLGVMLARRNAQRPPWRLVRPRIAASGVKLSWASEVAALVALYGVVAYVGGLARIRGWWDGRQMRLGRAVRGVPAATPE